MRCNVCAAAGLPDAQLLLPLRAANCVLLLFVDDVLDVTLARLGAAVFAVPCSRQEVTPCRQNARQG